MIAERLLKGRKEGRKEGKGGGKGRKERKTKGERVQTNSQPQDLLRCLRVPR